MSATPSLLPVPPAPATVAAAPGPGRPDAPSDLLAWFHRGLRACPDGVAVTSAGRSLTYREVDAQARALAGAVLEQVPRPRRLGVLAHRGADAYVALLAVLYAGAAVVPLNPDFPAARTAAMAAAADLCGVLVEPALDLPGEPGRAAPPRIPLDARAAEPLAQPRPVQVDDIAYILFTSGSTGRPKGVPVTHRNVGHYLGRVHSRYRFGPDDVFSQTFELTFDLAMFDLFCAWGSGGTLVTVPTAALVNLPAFLAEHRTTVWFSSPSVISLVRRQLRPDALPTLRWSLFCGEALLADDASDWQGAASASTVENLYGPTELTISCAMHRWDGATSPALCRNGVVPIGLLHDGLRHLVVTGPDAPPGAPGELCVTGPQMFPGYLDPADDEGRFLVRDGVRWYRTGDLVQALPNGELAYLGRRDHQVKVNGVRVELAEVDWAVRGCAGVEHAVTVLAGRELVTFYSGRPRPTSELVLELGAVLPRAVVPRLLVHVTEFPLNSNRKTDRGALARRATALLGRRPR